MSVETAKQLYEDGRLKAAIAAAIDQVRQNPLNRGARGFLAELLCFDGELERADKQLDLLADQDPEYAVGIARFRQLLRAAQARQQCFEEGRLPELLEPPSAGLTLYLEAAVRMRTGDDVEAGRLLAEAEDRRPHPHGTCNGRPFKELRDLNDPTAGFLEVLTGSGKYYWLPFETMSELRFDPPTRARDLLWRQTTITLSTEQTVQAFVPVIYPFSAKLGERAALGRATEWIEDPAGVVRGRGQRTLLVGDDAIEFMAIEEITIDQRETDDD